MEAMGEMIADQFFSSFGALWNPLGELINMQAFHFYPLKILLRGSEVGSRESACLIFSQGDSAADAPCITLWENISLWAEGKVLKSGCEWFRGKETVSRNHSPAPFHPIPYLEEYNIHIMLWAAYPVRP